MRSAPRTAFRDIEVKGNVSYCCWDTAEPSRRFLTGLPQRYPSCIRGSLSMTGSGSDTVDIGMTYKHTGLLVGKKISPLHFHSRRPGRHAGPREPASGRRYQVHPGQRRRHGHHRRIPVPRHVHPDDRHGHQRGQPGHHRRRSWTDDLRWPSADLPGQELHTTMTLTGSTDADQELIIFDIVHHSPRHRRQQPHRPWS